MVFHPGMFPTQSLLRMLQWTTDASGLFFNVDKYANVPLEMRSGCLSVLRLLLRAPHGIAAAVPSQEESESLLFLQDEGLVGGPPWKLTPLGEQCLQVSLRLHTPRPVLLRAAAKLAEATLAELILELEHQRWELVSIVGRREKKRIIQKGGYKKDEPESEKAWYIYKNTSPSKLYLRALLEAQAGSPVPHFGQEDDYRRLLKLPLGDTTARQSKKHRSEKIHAELGENDCAGDDFVALAVPKRASRVRCTPRVQEAVLPEPRIGQLHQQPSGGDNALEVGGGSSFPNVHVRTLVVGGICASSSGLRDAVLT